MFNIDIEVPPMANINLNVPDFTFIHNIEVYDAEPLEVEIQFVP